MNFSKCDLIVYRKYFSWRRRIKFILPLPPENNSGENEPLHIKLMCGMFAKLCVWNKSDVQPFLTLNLRLVINGHILIFSSKYLLATQFSTK